MTGDDYGTARSPARRDIVWEWCDRQGLEHLTLQNDGDAIRADGIVVTAFDGELLRLRYSILCDPGWRFREARVTLDRNGEPRDRRMARDPAGAWTVDGAARDDLAPCADIDIMATPFTNTLPLRRLAFPPETPVAITVAYLRVPDLGVSVVTQDYTRLGTGDAPARFHYRNPASGFSAELSLDADGVVIDYGGIWRRVSPR